METTSPPAASAQKRRPSPNTNNPLPKTSSLTRHERLCSICQHPRREDIDDDILRWRSPEDIAYDFKLGDRSTIYRHGRALNLFTQRKQNLNPALERVIESVYDAKPSAGVILKAMAIYARINGNEAFNDPPRRTIITHITVNNASAATLNPATNETVATRNDSLGPTCPEERRIDPEPPKDAAPVPEPNNSVGALLYPEERRACPERMKDAAPPSNSAQTESSGLGFTCPEERKNRAASLETNSRCDARTEYAESRSVHPEPPTETQGRAAQAIEVDAGSLQPATPAQPAGTFNQPDAAEAVLKPRLDPKRYFPFYTPLLIPICLLGWLFWFALAGSAGSAVSASTLPLPDSTVFYSLQNVQSQNAKSLKIRPESIFYSPQKRRFMRLRRQDAGATTARTILDPLQNAEALLDRDGGKGKRPIRTEATKRRGILRPDTTGPENDTQQFQD